MSIYADSDRAPLNLEELKKNKSKEYIIYLDNFTTQTLGKLIKKTKKIIDTLPAEETLILYCTNTHSSCDSNIIQVYREYGHYIQTLLDSGVKIILMIRGVLDLEVYSSLLECKCSKYISGTSNISNYGKNQDSKILIEAYNLQIL